ncbi:MAG: hypothetical protein HYW23_04210 [Candidatus Aenigmarchaeota archaeon]|nr:hypothetical protein [Candidatus Aenigmarchaeota archaeon]
MKKKTEIRLERKFLSAPLHHIDTSVVRENPTTQNGRYCVAYLNIVGTKYRGKFSIPMPGKYLLSTFNVHDYSKRVDLLEVIYSLIKKREIELVSINNIEKTTERIYGADRLIPASAIEDDAETFITLDEDLIHNETIEREFTIEIRHPKEKLS